MPETEINLGSFWGDFGPAFKMAEEAKERGDDVLIWLNPETGFLVASHYADRDINQSSMWSDCHTVEWNYYRTAREAISRWCGVYFPAFDAAGVFLPQMVAKYTLPDGSIAEFLENRYRTRFVLKRGDNYYGFPSIPSYDYVCTMFGILQPERITR